MKLGPFDFKWGNRPDPSESIETVAVDSLPSASTGLAAWEENIFDGEKFLGGMGPVQVSWTDYWSLRQRSSELFRQNLYAQGLVRRLVTNEINTGLHPETRPDEPILGYADGQLSEWSEDVENRFEIYASQPDICDHFRASTLYQIQEAARTEALIEGDVLVVLGQHPRAKVPTVRLVNAQLVQSPLAPEGVPDGHAVKHGVERDRQGRVVAYWIRQDVFEFKRIRARNARTGRRVAWLEFGEDKRYDDERGMPLLAVVLQSLKEIDRYRDAAVRKAVVNSIVALFITKKEDKPGTLPLTGGATRKQNVTTGETTVAQRNFKIRNQIPGLALEELQTGEEPKGFDSRGVDEKFGDFEEAIIQAVAWSREVPPEILKLAFSNNYSASQAAINEFKIYLERVRGKIGASFCRPIYVEWLISEAINGRVQAPGLVQAWRDPAQYVTFGAWTASNWYGSIKPSTDMFKQAKGSELLLQMGLTTRAREARNLTGTKFSKNVKQQIREAEQLREVLNILEPPVAEEPEPEKEDDKDDE